MNKNIQNDKKIVNFYENIKKDSKEYLNDYANSFKDHY